MVDGAWCVACGRKRVDKDNQYSNGLCNYCRRAKKRIEEERQRKSKLLNKKVKKNGDNMGR